MDCVAQTLSMNNVLPRGTYVKFDIDEYLAGMVEAEDIAETGEQEQMPDNAPGAPMEENTQEEMA
jgi:hypothetical protein